LIQESVADFDRRGAGEMAGRRTERRRSKKKQTEEHSRYL